MSDMQSSHFSGSFAKGIHPIIERGGVLLYPDPDDERETYGICNPAVAGNFLLYRAIARGNFSRIMAARLFSEVTDSGTTIIRAEKLGIAVLEPQEPHEYISETKGGVEDPRVTRLSTGQFIMLYTGFGLPHGFKESSAEFPGQFPSVALAVSSDGLKWQREGRIFFDPYESEKGISDLNLIPNKDAVLFSEKINGKYAMYHRPTPSKNQASELGIPWRAIWYSESDSLLGPWGSHKILVKPEFGWEGQGVGAGVPPLHVDDSWVNVYHGFRFHSSHNDYNAGIFTTPFDDPTRILYRSRLALLTPDLREEKEGAVPDVVFPTAVWYFEYDKKHPALFWGGADSRIIWGQLKLPTEITRINKL